jgi:hypothetical protein
MGNIGHDLDSLIADIGEDADGLEKTEAAESIRAEGQFHFLILEIKVG